MVVSTYYYCSEIIRAIGTHAKMQTSSPVPPSLTCTTFQVRKPPPFFPKPRLMTFFKSSVTHPMLPAESTAIDT